MIQCKDCEFCQAEAEGHKIFKCDPFTNIKEPECIAKWQLIRLDMLVASYHQMLKWQRKFSPLQDKIMRYMQREMEDIDEAESWKVDDQEDQEEEEEEDSKEEN